MNIIFTHTAFEQYTEWQATDRATLKIINELIKDISRNGVSQGMGKPEPLRYISAWSRRISHEHRLVYNLDSNKNIVIIACKGHYEE